MQTIKTLIALTLALGAGALVTGCEGRAHESGSIVIDRPAADVYPWLTDSAKRKQWVRGVVSIKDLTTDGPRVGAKVAETLDMGGQRTTVEAEVTALEPDRLLVVKGTAEDFDLGMRYELAETDGKTKIAWDADFRFKPVMAKLMIGVIAPDIKRKIDGDFVNLKAMAEKKAGS